MSTIADDPARMALVQEFSTRLRAGLVNQENARRFLRSLAESRQFTSPVPNMGKSGLLENLRWSVILGLYRNYDDYLDELTERKYLSDPWVMMSRSIPHGPDQLRALLVNGRDSSTEASAGWHDTIIEVRVSDLGYPYYDVPYFEVCKRAATDFGLAPCTLEHVFAMAIQHPEAAYNRELTFGMDGIPYKHDLGELTLTFELSWKGKKPKLIVVDARPHRWCRADKRFLFVCAD